MAGRFDRIGGTIRDWRRQSENRQWRSGLSSMAKLRWVVIIFLLLSLGSLFHGVVQRRPVLWTQHTIKHNLWETAPSFGWRASSLRQSQSWVPPQKSSGYLVVRGDGGLNQQRNFICDAVLAARIMNATLVLPHLDGESLGRNESGFSGIYDVERFVTSLRGDVRVVRTLPTTWVRENESIPFKPFQVRPPRDAPVSWYEIEAVEKMKEHGAVYLAPSSWRLFADDLDNLDYQRLRCRVAYHALGFTRDIRNLTNLMVERLRSEGPYVSVHLRFERCPDSTTEQEMLKTYREENDAKKELDPSQSRLMGKCPLTPKEVGLFLRALGFDNSTRVYVAAATGEVFGGSKLNPLRELFPNLESRMTLAKPEEFALVNGEGRSLLGPAVDYVACLLSEIFVPNYDGPSNFANNLIGQRLYFGFRTTLRPDRTALSSLFSAFDRGTLAESEFQASVRQTVSGQSSGSPRARTRAAVAPEEESFYTNPWPECFCSAFQRPDDLGLNCPSSLSRKTDPELNPDPNYYDQDLDDSLAGWNL